MSERYVGKIVSVSDEFTVVVNKGSENGIKEGDRFTVVGLGEEVVDPDTKQSLGKLEIVRGKVSATHVQEKISTLSSCEFSQEPDSKEITKVTKKTGGMKAISILAVGGTLDPEVITTESIKPGERSLRKLLGVKAGDLLVKA